MFDTVIQTSLNLHLESIIREFEGRMSPQIRESTKSQIAVEAGIEDRPPDST